MTETDTPTLVICRGLPASGKSTWAREWVTKDPAGRAEVNRDHLRMMLRGGYHPDAERQVTAARDATITALLQRGVSVVCSDTNLPQRTARDLARLARLAGAEVKVKDFTAVPLDECLRRDAARTDAVGETVIRDKYARYLAGRALPLPWPDDPHEDDAAGPAPYVPPVGAPKAVIVDVDGTVALMGTRSPFDETRVHEDRPNLPVIAAVRAMHIAGYRVVFLSGRTDACRDATAAWLIEHVFGVVEALHMRPVGDYRKDSVVKSELFDRHVRDHFDVVGVFDDRAAVVRMWRSIGLTVFHVAEGNF